MVDEEDLELNFLVAEPPPDMPEDIPISHREMCFYDGRHIAHVLARRDMEENAHIPGYAPKRFRYPAPPNTIRELVEKTEFEADVIKTHKLSPAYWAASGYPEDPEPAAAVSVEQLKAEGLITTSKPDTHTKAQPPQQPAAACAWESEPVGGVYEEVIDNITERLWVDKLPGTDGLCGGWILDPHPPEKIPDVAGGTPAQMWAAMGIGLSKQIRGGSGGKNGYRLPRLGMTYAVWFENLHVLKVGRCYKDTRFRSMLERGGRLVFVDWGTIAEQEQTILALLRQYFMPSFTGENDPAAGLILPGGRGWSECFSIATVEEFEQACWLYMRGIDEYAGQAATIAAGERLHEPETSGATLGSAANVSGAASICGRCGAGMCVCAPDMRGDLRERLHDPGTPRDTAFNDVSQSRGAANIPVGANLAHANNGLASGATPERIRISATCRAPGNCGTNCDCAPTSSSSTTTRATTSATTAAATSTRATTSTAPAATPPTPATPAASAAGVGGCAAVAGVVGVGFAVCAGWCADCDGRCNEVAGGDGGAAAAESAVASLGGGASGVVDAVRGFAISVAGAGGGVSGAVSVVRGFGIFAGGFLGGAEDTGAAAVVTCCRQWRAFPGVSAACGYRELAESCGGCFACGGGSAWQGGAVVAGAFAKDFAVSFLLRAPAGYGAALWEVSDCADVVGGVARSCAAGCDDGRCRLSGLVGGLLGGCFLGVFGVLFLGWFVSWWALFVLS